MSAFAFLVGVRPIRVKVFVGKKPMNTIFSYLISYYRTTYIINL